MKKLFAIFALLVTMVSSVYGQRIQGISPAQPMAASPQWKSVYISYDSTKTYQVEEFMDINSVETHVGRFRQANFRDVFSYISSKAAYREIMKTQVIDCGDTTTTVSKAIELDSLKNMVQAMQINSPDRLEWSPIKKETPNMIKFNILCR